MRAADPPADDFIMRNAMDAQEVAIGWWPGDPRYDKAAFYAYAHPAPEGFEGGSLSPAAARWEPALGEYVLDWEDVRATSDPRAAALEFATSAFHHACSVCQLGSGAAGQRRGLAAPGSLNARGDDRCDEGAIAIGPRCRYMRMRVGGSLAEGYRRLLWPSVIAGFLPFALLWLPGATGGRCW